MKPGKYVFVFFWLLCIFVSESVFCQSDELLGGIQQLIQKYQQGAYGEVLGLSEKILELSRKEFGEEDANYAIVLAVVAGAQNEMGKTAEAELNYTRALAILKNPTPPYASFVGMIYSGLGRIYHQRGIYDKAEEYILKSIALLAKTVGKADVNYANAVNDLGNLYKDAGDFANAEKFLKEAADIRLQTAGENSAVYGISLNNLGSLYEHLGDYRRGAVYYEQSYMIWKKVVGEYHPLIATALNNYAGLYVKTGNYEEAEKLYKNALVVCAKVYGEKDEKYATTLSNLGNAYRLGHDLENAEKYSYECLILRKEILGETHIDYAYSLNNLGLIRMDQKKFAAAEQMLGQALALFEKLLGRNHASVATCSANLGMVYFKENRPDKAALFLKKGLAIELDRIDYVFPSLNDKEKTLFYATLQKDFEFFNYFSSRYHEIDNSLITDIYAYTLATKALLLNASNKIKKRILSSGDLPLIQLYQEWKMKKTKLAQVWQMSDADKRNAGIDDLSLEAEVNALEKKLSQSSELFAAHQDKKRYAWRDIQRKLKPGEAAVEIIRFRKFNREFTDTVSYAALIVTPDSSSPEMVVLENGNLMESKMLAWYKNSIQHTLQDDKSYAVYWAPVASRLTGMRRIFLSPDGVYNQINVNALYNPATGKFVMDELEVQQVTNSKDILSLPRRLPVKTAAVLGFPDYGALAEDKVPAETDQSATLPDSLTRELGFTINALPGTLQEVTMVQKLLSASHVVADVYTGTSAREGLLMKLQSPSVLHIATHGFFLSDVRTSTGNTRSGFMGVNPERANENPLLRSGILLAGAQRSIAGKNAGKADDGILTAYEAMNLNLDDTQLVVLSACETGLGEIHNGEGVYGFQRALIIAGTKAIIMSLWKVDDEVTQMLMADFYRFWMEGKTKREAFILAQQKIRVTNPAPYFWAPFILIGN